MIVYTVYEIEIRFARRLTMDWVEFFKIVADFVMKLVAFFKGTDEDTTETSKETK